MERRLYLSKEKTDENDEQNDPRDESIEPQHTNMHTDENEENLPLVDFSNPTATPLLAFRIAFMSAFSALTGENLFHVSNTCPSSDIQPRISDAQVEEEASFSPTSGIRQRALGLESHEIAPDSTHRNVPDSIETGPSSSYQQNDGEISAPISHGVANQVRISDVLLENEICLPPSLQENNMEPILCPTRTNTETLDGNFCRVIFPNIDMLHEQNTSIVDPIVYHDDTEYNSDKAVEVSSTNDYDPQEGTSTMNIWVSPDKSSNLLPQKQFFESVGLNAVLNQHNLSSDYKIDESSRNDAGLADPTEDTSTMNTPAQLNSPLQIHTVEKPYKCKIRGETSTQKGSLKRHSRTHSSGSPHECDVCGKRFASNSSLKRHILTHSDDKRHECDICGRRFTEKGSLDIRTHSDKKPYECEICDKKFARKDNLKIHYRIHKGEKGYKCETCGKRFTQKGDLNRHVRAHSGEKPYKCETCGKRFTRNGSLKTHYRSHNCEEPYACELCGKRFKRKDHLSVHSKRHTSADPFKCEFCGEVFSNVDSLNRHRRTHHEK